MKKTILLSAAVLIILAATQHSSAQWQLTGNAGTNASTNFIGNTDNVALRFRTKNVNRMTITGSGNVGIGTTSPGYKLQVIGTGRFEDGVKMGGFGLVEVDAPGIIAGRFKLDSAGNVGVGVPHPAYKLEVAGDAKINDVVIGRGNGNINTNTVVGNGGLNANISGGGNTANGFQALYSNTTGGGNTAYGTKTLYSNISGNDNVANGYHALYANTANSNTAIGNYALTTNTTGYENTAIGNSALYSNTTGFNNSATGFGALNFNTTGSQNTANGYQALFKNTTGSSNNATGYHALYYNTTGTSNTATGWRALFSNTIGISNTANGDSALYSNTNGNYNTATGNGALFNNIGSSTLSIYPGSRNTANGYQALFSNNIGYDNTAIGFKALYTNADGIFNCASGWGALYSNTNGYENTAMGHEALYGNTTGDFNTALGAVALDENYTGIGNTAIGTGADVFSDGFSYSSALGINTTITASYQIRLGNNTVTSIGGFTNWSNISDGRFKKNIKEDVKGLEFINKLEPVTYTLDISGMNKYLKKDAPQRKNMEGRITMLPKDEAGIIAKEKIIYSGFIAQDVETAAKEVGYDFSGVDAPKNDKDFYGLRYAEFVVPLVKAVQELDNKNESLEKQNEEMKNEIANLKSAINSCCDNSSSKNQSLNVEQSNTDINVLFQNQPNPFSQSTVIGYLLMSDSKNASIVIRNLNGELLKTVTLAQSGKGQITINANELSQGTYTYTLIVNNQSVDTKLMVITK